MHKLAFLICGATFFVACSSSDATTAGDVDSSVDDAAVADTGVSDTARTDGGGGDGAKDAALDTAKDASGDTAAADSSTDATDATDTAVDDGGADTSSSDADLDAPGIACGADRRCTVGQLCVRTYTTGGACLICAGGTVCPTGKHCSGTCCVDDVPSYGYECKDAPTGCTPPATSCAGACGAGGCSAGCPCESATAEFVTCHCLAP